MARDKTETIPEEFRSLAEAADYWDTRDLTDHEDQMCDVQIEVELRRTAFLAALEPELAKRVAEHARNRGVSAETLVNLWLAERLSAASGER